jgi:ApeA N-terminal domain 1
MLEERTFEGYWWRPSDPETKLPGTLSFSQSDSRLELLGAFEDIKPGPLGAGDDEDRIVGIAKTREWVTLDGCLHLGQSLNFPGFSVTTYGPHMVYVGSAYEADEAIRFDELYVRLSDLDLWALASGFGHEMQWDPSGTSVTKLDVSYTPPEPIEVALDDETTIGITWAWTWNGTEEVTTEARIGQVASFKVRFAEPATVDTCLEYVGRLRTFLTLAVGRPGQVLAVTGVQVPPDDAEPDPFTKEKPGRRPVDPVSAREPAGDVGAQAPGRRDVVLRSEKHGLVFSRSFGLGSNGKRRWGQCSTATSTSATENTWRARSSSRASFAHWRRITGEPRIRAIFPTKITRAESSRSFPRFRPSIAIGSRRSSATATN